MKQKLTALASLIGIAALIGLVAPPLRTQVYDPYLRSIVLRQGGGAGTTYTATSPIDITGTVASCPTCSTAAGTLTANLPVIGGGSKAVAVGTRSGNTTAYVTTTGTQTSGRCVEIDANGNHIAAAAGCAAAASPEEHEASNSASLDFTTWYSASCDIYELQVVNAVPATNATNLRIIFSTDGGMTFDTTAIYSWTSVQVEPLGGPARDGESGVGYIAIANPVSNTSGHSVNGTYRIYNPGGAKYKQIWGGASLYNSSSSNHQAHYYGGTYASATAVNAFQVKFSSGNITSGMFRCKCAE